MAFTWGFINAAACAADEEALGAANLCHLLHFLIGLLPKWGRAGSWQNANILNVCQIVCDLCAVLYIDWLFFCFFIFLFVSFFQSCALLHDFRSLLLGLTQILSAAARRKTLPKVLIWLRTFNVAQQRQLAADFC